MCCSDHRVSALGGKPLATGLDTLCSTINQSLCRVIAEMITPVFTNRCKVGPLLQELGSFLALETKEELVVDRSAQGELLRINFNISYPSLSCEFATLDVSDALGTVGLHHWKQWILY